MSLFGIENENENEKNQINQNQDSTYLIGMLPDFEIKLIPRCIFFNAINGYRNAQYTHLKLENCDNVTVAFRFRTKDRRLFSIYPRNGFLTPKASVDVTVVITECDSWVRDPSEYVSKVQKIIVENMIVHPELKIPEDIQQHKSLCREIFHSTRKKMGNRGELSIYTKLRVVLPYYDFNTST